MSDQQQKISQTIRWAATAPNVMRAALAYSQMGLSVIPVRNKVCPIDWERSQNSRAGEKEIVYWYYQKLLDGVAIICGAISNNLVVLDFDGLNCVAEFQEIFPQLCQTYIILSGSRQGAHFYYFVEDLPPTTRTKGYELRADGHYVVAPPSPHPSGFSYSVYADYPVLCLNNLDNVVAWIKSKQKAKGYLPKGEPVGRFSDMPSAAGDDPFTFNPRNPGRQMKRDVYMRLAWLANAINTELGYLRSRKEGERNDTLFRASIVLSQLVGGGELNEAQTRNELLKAALDNGTPQDEALRTIESGFKRGLSEPRRVPQSPKRA